MFLSKAPRKKKQSQTQTEKDIGEFLKAMTTMNKRIAQATGQPIPTLPKQKKHPPAMAMSPFPMASQYGSAICPRCGHTFKPEKPLKECPDCGLTVGIEDDEGEMEWSEDMKEPIPPFVYSAQSPEEIFYKSIRWHYEKWIAKLKGNPSSRMKF